jgi:hypothetical protein
MDKKIDYRRINCGIFLNPEEHKIVGNTMVFHPEFLNRYNDYHKWFADLFEDMLVERFGEEGWAIFFTQVTQHEPYFFADFYLDSHIDYNTISAYVANTLLLKQIRCMPFLRGTLQDFISNP